MSGRGAVILGAVALVTTVLASVPAGGATVQADVAWSTDDGFRGDLVYRVEIDPGASNDCEVVFQFAGPTVEDPRMRWWLSSADLGISLHDQEPEPTHVRVGPFEYERPGGATPFVWWNNITIEGSFSEPFAFTAAGLDVSNVPHTMPGGGQHTHPGAGLTVDCQDPVTVTPLGGSHEVVAVTEDDAHAETSTSEVDASVDGPPGIEATFDTDSAVLAWDVTAGNGAAATIGTLEHPEGTRTWRGVTSPATGTEGHARFLGPGGTYSFSTLHAGVGYDEGVRGILAGLDPLASLDDLA